MILNPFFFLSYTNHKSTQKPFSNLGKWEEQKVGQQIGQKDGKPFYLNFLNLNQAKQMLCV